MAEGVRWLTDAEQRAWRRFVAIVQLLPGVLDAPLQRETGLTYFSYVVLAMLSEAPERTLRMSDLAALTNASLSRASHGVSRLEREGWVRREAAPDDRRATDVTLTEAGWRVVVEAAPVHVASVRDAVIDRLSAEQLAALDDICHTLLATLPVEGRLSTFNVPGPRPH
jgi:DNA-binding MarR family transcriptional regulator